MTPGEKQLLLKDLCGRLPYGVKCKILTRDINGNEVVYEDKEELTIYRVRRLGNEYMTVIPYLFPVQSMTTEQRKEYVHIANKYGNIASSQSSGMTIQDWFDKNHIDYRGLIPKGLAEDATGLNIY